jgi:hypothetical protein
MSLHLYAGLRVRDFQAARPWYEQLLSEPTFLPNATEAVWTLAQDRSVYVVEHADGAGHSVVTVFVDDLDANVAAIAARGLEPDEHLTYSNGVRKALYRDPEVPIRILQTLTPTSRLKLAQRVAAEVGGEHEVDEQLLAELLAERLRDAELFLELPSRAAADLTGNGARLRDVLSAIGPLVEAGYVVRGRSLRCPLCNFPLWFGLDKLAEEVRCDACRASFTLPVATPDGRREPPIEYRLDGLTARAMTRISFQCFSLCVRRVGFSGDICSTPGLASSFPQVTMRPTSTCWHTVPGCSAARSRIMPAGLADRSSTSCWSSVTE